MGSNNSEHKKGHTQLKAKRKILVISTIIIAILFSIITISSTLYVLVTRYETSFNAAVHAIERQYLSTIKKDACYAQAMTDVSNDYANYSAYYISEHGYNRTTVSELYDEIGVYFTGVYYKGTIDRKNNISEGKTLSLYEYKETISLPELTPSHLYTLVTEGTYTDSDEYTYTCAKIDDNSYVILIWKADDFILRQSIFSAFPSDMSETLCRINADTMLIEDSNKSELIGTSVEQSICSIENFNILKSEKLDVVSDPSNTSSNIIFKCKDLENMYLVEYVPAKELLSLFLRRCAVPLILTNIFLFLILVYVLGFMKPHDNNEKAQIEYFHFFKNIYSDSRLVSHNLGIGLMAMAVVIISTLYVQTLINYCNQNVNATYNLTTLNCFIENADTNAEAMYNDFIYSYSLFSETLADYFLKHPEEATDDGLLKMQSHLPKISSITIMDNTATIVADTSTRNGYTISSDESSAEYVCWDVLDGECEYSAYASEVSFYIVSRRQDAVGVIRIGVDASPLATFEELCSIDEQLKSVDFQSSNKGYIEKEDIDTLYMMDSKTGEIEAVDSPIKDEKLLSDDFSGIRKLNGKRFVVNVAEADNYYLISALDFSAISGGKSLLDIISIFITFFLQQFIIFLISLRRKAETPNKLIEITNSSSMNQSIYDQMMDSNFRRLFRNVLIITGITVVALLIIDSLFGSTSILSYIFEASWPKGFNLFSLTMILITFVLGLLISRVIQWLIIFFTSSMGPRGLTIGKMLCSFIRFVTLIIVLLLILIDLGIDYKTLLAGAGIAGVAITVCAQSSVSDMLSGFLIVFENQFNIGDWLTVGDFRGEVTDIGMRTTKLQISKTVKILNNSELKNVTVMERNGQGCVVLVDIAYKEDANKVIELLRNSTERYVRDIPAIKEGPFVDGIVDLNASGVTLYMWAITDLEVVRATERELRRVTKNIFDENNIEIPFTQVTLHQADEIAHFKGMDVNVDENNSDQDE